MKTYHVIRIWMCMLLMPVVSFAQVPVNTFSTVTTYVVLGGTSTQVVTSHSASVNGITPSTSYTVKYNNTGNIRIVDFTLSGKTYTQFSTFDTVILRRVANSWETTGGNKQHIYCQGAATVDNTTYQMPFPIAYPQVTGGDFMQRVMKEGLINRGSDNVFNNDATSDLTFNNIERVDFVYKTGFATTNVTAAGFLIAERGGNDAFKIAAITAIDLNGNPTAFGAVLTVNTSAYGAVITSMPTYVMRKDPADASLRPFSMVASQSVKALFVRLSDLTIAPLERVYGYALMATDVTALTSAQVLAYTNSTYFPLTTNSTSGGMDLASAPGIYHTDLILDAEFINLTAQNNNNDQLLRWTDNNYTEVKEYELEKSVDREHFEKIATISAGQSAFYSFTDREFKISSYYRVRAILKNGRSYTSSIVFAKNTSPSGNVLLYPNPATDRINLNFEGSYRPATISVIAVDGKECARWSVNNNSQSIQLDISALSRGHYFIRLIDRNGAQRTYPVIKQ